MGLGRKTGGQSKIIVKWATFFFHLYPENCPALQIRTVFTCSYFKYIFLLLIILYMDRIHIEDDRIGHIFIDHALTFINIPGDYIHQDARKHIRKRNHLRQPNLGKRVSSIKYLFFRLAAQIRQQKKDASKLVSIQDRLFKETQAFTLQSKPLMKLIDQILGHFILSYHKFIKIISDLRHRSSQGGTPAHLNKLSVAQDGFLFELSKGPV